MRRRWRTSRPTPRTGRRGTWPSEAGMSPSSVGRIWQAFGLKPWLTDTFKLSEDPQFVDKVRDVVGLYMNPPEQAVVMCVDEKTGIQALDRTQPILPMRPGQIERRTHDYKRHGVTDLFAALNLATGQVVHQTRPQHRAVEFRKFLDTIDARRARRPRRPRRAGQLHRPTRPRPSHAGCCATPASRSTSRRPSSSWLNLVERWFAELTRKMLQRSAHKRSRRSPPTSTPGSPPGTTTPNRSSGTRPPTRSSTASRNIHEPLTQDTSRATLNGWFTSAEIAGVSQWRGRRPRAPPTGSRWPRRPGRRGSGVVGASSRSRSATTCSPMAMASTVRPAD